LLATKHPSFSIAIDLELSRKGAAEFDSASDHVSVWVLLTAVARLLPAVLLAGLWANLAQEGEHAIDRV
jgi:hypothetical protein